MTPRDLVAQLRDIHLPTPAEPDWALPAFASWPIVIFVVLVGGVLALAHWRRNAWRHHLRARLSCARREPDQGQRVSQLLDIALEIVQHNKSAPSLPALAYRSPATLQPHEITALEDFLLAQTHR